MIKRLLVLAFMASLLTPSFAQTLKVPQPSPTQTIKQDFAVGNIELSYSRPGMKGRKVFGDLVPFGTIWRTGANNATTLNFSDSVIIGGTRIAPGKYGLLSIPNKDQWTLIITKQLNVTSPAAYKQENDVVRVTAKTEATKSAFETFTMQFSNVKANSTDLQIMWENTMVTLPISAEFDAKVTTDIANALKDNRPYFQAAMYYLENNKDIQQAITWLDLAIEQNPSAFWVYHQKANALARQGKKGDAVAAAQKSIELARKASNDDYVKLNEKLIASLK